MTRLRQNVQYGNITDNPLTPGATTMNSAGLVALIPVSGSDDLLLTLDPGALYGNPEIVRVTAHSASSTSATIVRGHDGTTARQHVAGVPWVCAPVVEDVIVQCTSSTRPATGLYVGEMAFETDTGRLIRWSGSAWLSVADPYFVDLAWMHYS